MPSRVARASIARASIVYTYNNCGENSNEPAPHTGIYKQRRKGNKRDKSELLRAALEEARATGGGRIASVVCVCVAVKMLSAVY